MEVKQVKDLLEAYSSIYEKKEEPEMEEGEGKESEKDEGGNHKEGKHPKGKEEKGEKVTEKEGKEKEDEREMKEGADLFDYILEHLVAEGYADTNQAALAIMANMSEEWRNSILEQMGPTDSMADKQKATWNKGQKLSDPRAQKIYNRMTGPNPVKLPPA